MQFTMNVSGDQRFAQVCYSRTFKWSAPKTRISSLW